MTVTWKAPVASVLPTARYPAPAAISMSLFANADLPVTVMTPSWMVLEVISSLPPENLCAPMPVVTALLDVVGAGKY